MPAGPRLDQANAKAAAKRATCENTKKEGETEKEGLLDFKHTHVRAAALAYQRGRLRDRWNRFGIFLLWLTATTVQVAEDARPLCCR